MCALQTHCSRNRKLEDKEESANVNKRRKVSTGKHEKKIIRSILAWRMHEVNNVYISVGKVVQLTGRRCRQEKPTCCIVVRRREPRIKSTTQRRRASTMDAVARPNLNSKLHPLPLPFIYLIFSLSQPRHIETKVSGERVKGNRARSQISSTCSVIYFYVSVDDGDGDKGERGGGKNRKRNGNCPEILQTVPLARRFVPFKSVNTETRFLLYCSCVLWLIVRMSLW